MLFADLTELHTCLALDLMSGRAGEQWWWRVVYPSGDFAGALLSALTEQPQRLPALFERLSRQNQAAAFASLLDEETSRSLGQAVARVFDLAGAETLFIGVPHEVADSGSRAGLQSQPPQETQWTQQARPSQTGEQAKLRIKHPQPSPAEDLSLLRRLEQALPEIQQPGLPAATRTLVLVALGLARQPALLRAAAAAGTLAVLAVPASPAVQNTSSPGLPSSLPRSRELLQPGPDVPPSPPAQRVAALAVQEPPAPLLPAAQISAASSPGNPVPPPEEGLQMDTQFGGVFYLLNTLVYLGIYSDFTEPRKPGWALSPWDLLSALSLHWFGQAFKADPLFELFASLVGRPPNQDPAAGFSPPPGWQAALGLEDIPSESHWLEVLADFLVLRLVKALAREAPLTFCAQPAKVKLSSTRMDITFDLTSHPIEIRLAGLDRDLGWLPAAGMYIYYHYEI